MSRTARRISLPGPSLPLLCRISITLTCCLFFLSAVSFSVFSVTCKQLNAVWFPLGQTPGVSSWCWGDESWPAVRARPPEGCACGWPAESRADICDKMPELAWRKAPLGHSWAHEQFRWLLRDPAREGFGQGRQRFAPGESRPMEEALVLRRRAVRPRSAARCWPPSSAGWVAEAWGQEAWLSRGQAGPRARLQRAQAGGRAAPACVPAVDGCLGWAAGPPVVQKLSSRRVSLSAQLWPRQLGLLLLDGGRWRSLRFNFCCSLRSLLLFAVYLVGCSHKYRKDTLVLTLENSAFLIIIESQSDVGWGDLIDHPIPTPCRGQGPLLPDQGTRSPVQPGLEHCQGAGSHSFSGQPGPGPHHPHGEEFLPCIQSEPTRLQCEAIPPCPVTPHACPSPSPALSQHLQALAAALRSPCSLLLPRLSSPSSPSRSSQQRGSSPRIMAGASSGPAPTAPALSCAEGSRAGRRTPGGLSRAGQRGRIPSLALCPRCWGFSPGPGSLSGLPALTAGSCPASHPQHLFLFS